MADEPAAGDTGTEAQILAILDRLDDPHETYGEFIDRDFWNEHPSRRTSGNAGGEYEEPESWADTWHKCTGEIRAYVADPDAIGNADELDRAATFLVDFVAALYRSDEEWQDIIAGNPAPPPRDVPAELVTDVSRLGSLLRSILPRECGSCHKPFRPKPPGTDWCHRCRQGYGNLHGVEIALNDWWKNRHRLPESLAGNSAFNDLRQVVHERFDVVLGDNGKAWDQADVDRQRDAWEKVKLSLRKKKPASADEHEWRKEMLAKQIPDVVAMLREANAAPPKRSSIEIGTLRLVAGQFAAMPLANGILNQLAKAYEANPSEENLERFADKFDEYKAATADPEQEARYAALAEMPEAEFFGKFVPPVNDTSPVQQSPDKHVDKVAKAKRSTEPGEARAKLISMLTKHHDYDNGSCLNLTPIGNNELAKLVDVDGATASRFFRKEFNGHGKYKVICAKVGTLVAALKLLNQEFPPHRLLGASPPDNGERDEE